MSKNNLLFAQLTKVDAEKRLVYGRAAQEHPDHSDEIMDYDSSKPLFQKWSQVSKDATGGASVGNLRAMHGKVAAGKLTDISFNDEEKAIDICAKVVDDNEWKKVMEGVYTGFSIGGGYEKRWNDTTNVALTRYTANPAEISLVDRPCIPTATFFEVQKADGVVEKVSFKPATETLEVKGSDDEVIAFAKHLNDNNLSMGDVLATLQKVAARDDTSPKEGAAKYGDVKFADAKNKKYPIDNEAHIRAAWNYINKDKNAAKYSADDLSTIKAAVASAWKEKIDKDGPPSADASKAAEAGDLTKAAPALKKGLYTVQTMASQLQSMQYMLSSVEYEEEQEQDDSDIPARLNDVVMALGQILVDYTAEEVAELTAQNKGGDNISSPVMEMSQVATDLVKRATEFKKAGARHSAADLQKVQAMHDQAVALGAACGAADKSMAATGLEKTDDVQHIASINDLTKLDAFQDTLNKAIAAATEPMQKALAEAQVQIKKLEEMPAPTKAVLRVIGKGEDLNVSESSEQTIEKVHTPDGKESEAGSLIKAMHKQGGIQVRY
jgi:hypothetical protein